VSLSPALKLKLGGPLVLAILIVLIAISVIASIGFFMSNLFHLDPAPFIGFCKTLVYGFDSWGAHYSAMLFLLVFLFGFIYFTIRFSGVTMGNEADDSEQVLSKVGIKSRILPLLCFVGIVALTVFITSYRYLHSFTPQGADTPVYVGGINDVRYQFNFGNILLTGRDLTHLVTVAIVLFSNAFISFTESVMLIPIVLTVLYVFSVYFFVKVGTKSPTKALLVAAITPLSFFVTRLSLDLYSQLFGLTMMFFAFAFYLKVLEGKKRLLIPTAIVFAVALFSHMWTWLIFICCLPLFIVLSSNETNRLGDVRGKIWLTLKILVPSFILLSLTTFLNSRIPANLFYVYDVGELHFFNLFSGWNAIAGNETLLIWVFAFIGLIAMSLRRTRFNLLVLSLVISLSVLTLILGYDQTYRMLIVFPIPLIVGEGIYFLTKRLSDYSKIKLSLRWPNLHRFLMIFVIFMMLFATALPRSYIASWVYYPSDAGMDQFSAIQTHYGYGNHSILILIEVPSGDVSNRFRWAHAITGADIFIGNFTSLLENQTFQIDQSHWQSYNLSSYNEFIIPSALYDVTSFEKSISCDVGDGLFVVSDVSNVTLHMDQGQLMVSDL
jgi:hypothetical protein